MALITPSVLISNIAGKAGSVVFSRWKGRGYVRKHVIPTISMTQGHIDQRNRVGKVVMWWHQTPSALHLQCKAAAESASISGWNLFARDNLNAMFASNDEPIAPLTSLVQPINDDLEGEAGTNPGEIDLTWTHGEAAHGDTVRVYFEPSDTPRQLGDLSVSVVTGTGTQSESMTVMAPAAAVEYNIWMLVYNASDQTYSVARKCQATSKAGT